MDNTTPNQPQNPQYPQNPQNPPTSPYPQNPQNPQNPQYPQYQAPAPNYGGQPPYGQPPANTRRIPQLKRWQWIAAGVGALVIVCCLCDSIVSAMNNSGGASTTQTKLAASSTGPTATPQPTATKAPIATPNPQAVYTNLAQQNCKDTSGDPITTKWDPASQTVTITTTMGETWDVNSMQIAVKSDVFNCFHGFYSSPHATQVQDVVVTINGPIVDQYGNSSTGLYGSAELTRQTASKFQWNNIDYETAWDNNDYDNQFVRTK